MNEANKKRNHNHLEVPSFPIIDAEIIVWAPWVVAIVSKDYCQVVADYLDTNSGAIRPCFRDNNGRDNNGWVFSEGVAFPRRELEQQHVDDVKSRINRSTFIRSK